MATSLASSEREDQPLWACFDIFGTGDQEQAARDQIAGINSGQQQATSAINTGSNLLNQNYAAALQPYQSILTNLQNGSTATGANAYADATGANGTAGNARAVANFQQAPGYQSTLDAGLQAIQRAHAAAGNLSSGNADADSAKYAEGLANQGYQQYVQNLSPYLQGTNQQLAAAGGIAGVNTGLGNQLNANQGSLANLNWNAATGIGNANANADLAGLTASGNLVGALMSFL